MSEILHKIDSQEKIVDCYFNILKAMANMWTTLDNQGCWKARYYHTLLSHDIFKETLTLLELHVPYFKDNIEKMFLYEDLKGFYGNFLEDIQPRNIAASERCCCEPDPEEEG